MINVHAYFYLSNLETSVPGWAQSEGYCNCDSGLLSRFYKLFAFR